MSADKNVMNGLLTPATGHPGQRQSDQDAERAGGAVHGRHGEARQTGGGAQDVHHERQRWARKSLTMNVLPSMCEVWLHRFGNQSRCRTTISLFYVICI